MQLLCIQCGGCHDPHPWGMEGTKHHGRTVSTHQPNLLLPQFGEGGYRGGRDHGSLEVVGVAVEWLLRCSAVCAGELYTASPCRGHQLETHLFGLYMGVEDLVLKGNSFLDTGQCHVLCYMAEVVVGS